MKSDEARNEDPTDLIPYERHLPSVSPTDELNLVERASIAVEKADAIGRIRMAIANLLIEEGLMKRRRR